MLVLIDGHSSLYRAYYAIRHLSTAEGVPTNAVFGFVQILHRVLDLFKPSHCGVAFDVAKKTFRTDLYPEYKSTRKPMPGDLRPQIPLIKEILRAMEIPVLELEDYEADDVIATIASRHAQMGEDVTIVSSDKDLMQLLTDKISLYHTSWNQSVSPAYFIEKMGFRPELMTDFQGIMGDSSDNIPGVRGVGEKGASTLVTTYGTLEEIYEHLDELKGALAKKMAEGKKSAFLSRELATLKRDLGLDVTEMDLKHNPPDTAKLRELYNQLEFTSLARKLSHRVVHEIRLLEGEPDWDHLETAAISMEGENLSISTSSETYYTVTAKRWKEASEGREIRWITYDSKEFFGKWISPNDPKPPLPEDVKLLAYLLDPGRGELALPELAQKYLGIAEIQNPAPILYALCTLLKREVEEQGMLELYETIERPAVPILKSMELSGVFIEKKILEDLSDDLARKMADLEAKIYKLAGHPFNINSPKQLRNILYVEMQVEPPGVKTTKTRQYSTGEQALRELINRGHDFPGLILKYREVAKLKGTYVDPIPRLLDGKDRLHTTFHQTVTATGRLSSSDPNVQNIPIRTELGRGIRRAFAAPPGRLLIAADYSQIELRLLAHFSKDPVLIEAFKEGKDIHTATAAKIFNLDEASVTPDYRRRAKTVNFGVLYGMSAHGLSQQLEIERGKAQHFIDSYFRGFPEVKNYFDNILEEARSSGVVRTLSGRLRRIPEIKSSNFNIRSNAERMAINAPLQGSAADIIKMAMVQLQQKVIISNKDVTMLLQIHDELLFETPQEIADEIMQRVVDVMENVIQISVPLCVDAGVGPNWEEVK